MRESALPTPPAITVNRIREIVCHKCGQTADISKAKPLSTIACPSCATEMRVPAQIDQFLLVRQIAVGSTGAVYLAYDENLCRQVAFKLIYKAGDRQQAYDQCVREARMLAMVNHPNVVQVHSMSEDMGQPYIVMELLDGGTMADLFKQRPLDERRALAIALDVTRGLRAAYRLKLVHGDIKPENILLNREGVAKLIDFSLSQQSRDWTFDGKIRGSPYYLAPEVIRGERPEPPSDIYNLGATLFHAIAGRPPFVGRDAREVLQKRLLERAPKLHERARVQPTTSRLIDQMLHPRPERRPGDYDQLMSAIQDALNALQPPIEP